MRKVALIKHLSLNRIIILRRMKCISKIKPNNTQIPRIIKAILLLLGIISVIHLVNHILWPITIITMILNLISWFYFKDSRAQIANNLWIFLYSEKKNTKEKKICSFFPSTFSKYFLSLSIFLFFILVFVSCCSVFSNI